MPKTIALKTLLEEYTSGYTEFDVYIDPSDDERQQELRKHIGQLSLEDVTVDFLRQQLQQKSFREPIIVSYDNKTIFDGMRRITASILEEQDSIETIDLSEAIERKDEDYLEVSFTVSPITVMPVDFNQCIIFSSLPVGQEDWVTSSFLSWNDEERKITAYYAWKIERSEELAVAISRHGNSSGIRVSHVTFDDMRD